MMKKGSGKNKDSLGVTGKSRFTLFVIVSLQHWQKHPPRRTDMAICTAFEEGYCHSKSDSSNFFKSTDYCGLRKWAEKVTRGIKLMIY